jgi:hypothetical protein
MCLLLAGSWLAAATTADVMFDATCSMHPAPGSPARGYLLLTVADALNFVVCRLCILHDTSLTKSRRHKALTDLS